MFRSILVPLDGTSDAAAALPQARDIADATGGALHLFTVAADASSTASQSALGYLESLVTELQGEHMHADAVVRAGEPATQILSYARSHDVDLIVMATRAVGNRSILALTSVARQVLTDSPCPVLLLHPGSIHSVRLRTLLVPVDGSPGGSLALAAARALCHARGSCIILLNVVVPVPSEAFAALPGMTVGGYIDPEWEDVARTTARLYVESLARRLHDVGVDSEGRVATGDVAAEILRCADEVEADMIVMSTHSVAWPARAYVSSVADRVLREGSRPVLLVRREAPVGEPASQAREYIAHART